MKHLSGLIFLAFIVYLGWPYVHVYQLNNAVVKHDKATFERLVDIEAIRKTYKENLEWRINQIGGSQKNILSDMMRQGAKALGGFATDTVIETDSVLKVLRELTPLWERLTFAFFESPTRFIIRFGELGHNPIHIQLTLQDWNWRVTAIYN